LHGFSGKTGFDKLIYKGMAPFIEFTDSHPWISLFSALIIGIGFGFALEQAGFSSSRKLVGMFYGYDATVLKVFFTAAIVAMLGTQFLSYFGLIDMDMVFVNPYFVQSAITGGVIMGAGFVMGGFCPGTGISAASIGKIDAFFYLLGGAAGAFIFGEMYPFIEKLFLAGNKGPVKLSDALGTGDGLFILLVILAAISMFWLAEKAEKKFARPDITAEL
jgi:hypothetical protein